MPQQQRRVRQAPGGTAPHAPQEPHPGPERLAQGPPGPLPQMHRSRGAVQRGPGVRPAVERAAPRCASPARRPPRHGHPPGTRRCKEDKTNEADSRPGSKRVGSMVSKEHTEELDHVPLPPPLLPSKMHHQCTKCTARAHARQGQQARQSPQGPGGPAKKTSPGINRKKRGSHHVRLLLGSLEEGPHLCQPRPLGAPRRQCGRRLCGCRPPPLCQRLQGLQDRQQVEGGGGGRQRGDGRQVVRQEGHAAPGTGWGGGRGGEDREGGAGRGLLQPTRHRLAPHRGARSRRRPPPASAPV